DGSSERAGDGTRTRDSLLGRQELYQLSYSRILLTNRSGCADLNRGPPAPKAGALPTALHPVGTSFSTRMCVHYSTPLAICQVLPSAFFAAVAYLEQEEIPARGDTTEGITSYRCHLAIARG